MKKLIILLSITMLGILTKNYSQNNWAPVGAKWYYDLPVFEGMLYTTIESVGDTTIQGMGCRILQTTSNFDQIRVYSHENDGVVSVYANGMFYILYNFNAAIGSTWQTINLFHPSEPDSVAIVRVDSIGTVSINNQTLRYVVVSFPNGGWWGYNCYGYEGDSYKIIEHIGSLGYMFPQYYTSPDYPYPCNLRCYDDNQFGHFETGVADSCNYTVVSVEELDNLSDLDINIYPNPTKDIINVDMNCTVCSGLLTIYSVFGTSVLTKTLKGTHNILDLSTIPKGYYFIRFSQNNLFTFNKIIKL